METQEDNNFCSSENKSKGENLPHKELELAKGVLFIHS